MGYAHSVAKPDEAMHAVGGAHGGNLSDLLNHLLPPLLQLLGEG